MPALPGFLLLNERSFSMILPCWDRDLSWVDARKAAG
jgi:hypothetical protein